jgi:hypothetical protein
VLGEDRQVGVQPHPIQPMDAERWQRPLVLESPELALAAPRLRYRAVQRFDSRGTSGCSGSALTVLAGRRLVVALGHGGRLAERDDRAAVAVLAPVVDRPTSQPLSIEHAKALRVLRLSSFCASVASRPSSGGSERRAAMTSQASAEAWERLLSDLLSRSARGRWRAHSSAAPSTTAIRRGMPSARRCTRPPERGHDRRRRKRSNRQSQVACCGVAQDRRRGGQLRCCGKWRMRWSALTTAGWE